MTINDILNTRLQSLQLTETSFSSVQQLVQYMGGIQSQDYNSSKLCIATRIRTIKESDIENAIATKKIIRTWLFRGTIHLVSSNDLVWQMQLLAPKIIKSCASRYKNLELDDKLFNSCFKTFEQVLANGQQLTRDELSLILKQKNKIDANGLRLAHILQRASFEQLICFGSKRSKEYTFTLLDETVPKNKFNKDEALSILAERYFTSHGAATIQDFCQFSGLSLGDAKKGFESIQKKFVKTTVNGLEYWHSEKTAIKKNTANNILFLPAFDEYILSYRNRNLFLDPAYSKQVVTSNGLFKATVIKGNQVIATWKNTIKKDRVNIEVEPFYATKIPANEIEKAEDWLTNFYF